MSVIRAFIAIDLSPEIQKCLDQVSADLKQRLSGVPVRWVAADNIHLTLKFLGDVSLSNLEVVKKIMKAGISTHRSFEISVGGLGVFPKVQNPRVIWIGLEIPPELIAIQHGLEIETTRLGYGREERPFSPHLTLGRVSRNASASEIHKISEVLVNFKLGFLGVTRVQTVHLFRSDLSPGGAMYTRIFSVSLEESISPGM